MITSLLQLLRDLTSVRLWISKKVERISTTVFSEWPSTDATIECKPQDEIDSVCWVTNALQYRTSTIDNGTGEWIVTPVASTGIRWNISNAVSIARDLLIVCVVEKILVIRGWSSGIVKIQSHVTTKTHGSIELWYVAYSYSELSNLIPK